MIEITDSIAAIRTRQFQHASGAFRSFRQGRCSQAQLADFARPDTNDLLCQYFGVFVLTRGDVDDQTSCHRTRHACHAKPGARIRPFTLATVIFTVALNAPFYRLSLMLAKE